MIIHFSLFFQEVVEPKSAIKKIIERTGCRSCAKMITDGVEEKEEKCRNMNKGQFIRSNNMP